MWWWWLGVAVASDGYELVRTVHDCAISMRPPEHPDGAAMRAVCSWPELQVEPMVELLGSYERYPEFVFAIDVSRIERTDGERVLVYQRQEMFGISDREVLLWLERQPVPGGARFAWTTAADEPLSLDDGSIRVPRNVGFWEVAAADSGGVRVVHEIAMDAGGSIPRWLVQLVRTRGFARVMGDVRRIVGQGEG